MNRNTKLIGILLTCCCIGQCLVVGNNIKLKHKTIRLQDDNKFYKNQHKKITNENINLKSLNETLDKNNKILTQKNEDLRKSNESLLKENKELEYK